MRALAMCGAPSATFGPLLDHSHFRAEPAGLPVFGCRRISRLPNFAQRGLGTSRRDLSRTNPKPVSIGCTAVGLNEEGLGVVWRR